MKKLVIILILILALPLNIMPVAANNITGDYSETEWYQALIALLVEFPSLFDKDYVEAMQSRGELPFDAVVDESDGEVYYIYQWYFSDPGAEWNLPLAFYGLYASERSDSFFFMVYKFNETSGKYEFTERISIPAQVVLEEPLYGTDSGILFRYKLINYADDIIEYAKNVFDNMYPDGFITPILYNGFENETETTQQPAPQTGDSLGSILLVLLVVSSIFSIILCKLKHLLCNDKLYVR